MKIQFDTINKTIKIEEQEDINVTSHKNYASVKRSAFDLKNELTKLTNDSIYKWSR